MAQKLRKIGNSVGLILPKKLLERNHLDVGSLVEVVETNPGELVIRPVQESPAMSPEVAQWYRGFKQRYGEALRNLAQ